MVRDPGEEPDMTALTAANPDFEELVKGAVLSMRNINLDNG